MTWIVTCEGYPVADPFDDEEDADAFAGIWNYAYPVEKGYPEFVVEEQA